MNFKSDWSFLEKISMGAVSSKAVVETLNAEGHQIIELERYSTSNKIWSTKIKRFRLPDLICLKCGKRIESRAKTKLEVKMSDNENNQDRRWDVGLRDEDVIAFIQCRKDADEWIPSRTVNVFSTKSLRDSICHSRLGDAKSAYEGAERDRTWKTTVPKKAGTVVDVYTDSSNGTQKVKVQFDDGTGYTYSISPDRGMKVYVNPGDRFGTQDTIIAGVLSEKENISCSGQQYDFLSDLQSGISEIRYAGVKALGYVVRSVQHIEALYTLLSTERDHRIILEIYSSLIRLGENVWDEFHNYVYSLSQNEYVLEAALILGELQEYAKASELLLQMALDEGLSEEIRAAAVWGMCVNQNTLKPLIELAMSDIQILSSHALANIEENMHSELTGPLIRLIDSDQSGELILTIFTEATDIDRKTIIDSLIRTEDPIVKKWLLMIVGFSGRSCFAEYANMLSANCEQMTIINYLWDYTDVEISINYRQSVNFLRKQTIRG